MDTLPETPVNKTDFYIKLSSEADMPTALSAFYKQDYTTVVDPETGEETQVPEGNPYLVTTTHDYAMDIVGTIYKPTGNMLTDIEGHEYPEMAPIDGWHINIRLGSEKRRADVEALSAYFVDPEPATPERIWL
jgi:hypothetical protein